MFLDDERTERGIQRTLCLEIFVALLHYTQGRVFLEIMGPHLDKREGPSFHLVVRALVVILTSASVYPPHREDLLCP